MRRTFASGNGTGTGGMGAVCADCSRDILGLRAKMLQEIHELSVHCAKLGHDNVDLRKIIVMNQLEVHGRLSKLTFETLASCVAGVVGSFAFFMAPFVRESWRAKRKERTLAEAMSPTESPKEEEGGGALVKAKSPKEEEEEGGAALVKTKSSKEEGGGALVKAKSPKEEEEEGGAALVKAKSPKEEEGSGGFAV